MPTATEAPPNESRSISSFYTPWSLADGNSPQLEFHTCPAKNRLQVGSYGSGKSKPLLMEGIFHALEYPGSDSIILRKTVPDLKRTVIDKFLSDVPRWVYESYNQSDHIVRFHPQPEIVDGKPTGKMLQSKLRFGACEREADVGKYLSTEYVFIGFEELGEFSFGIWDALAGRNRCPIPGSRPCMAGATNPMGVGWSWIKKLWVDHKAFQGMDAEKYDPSEYVYFHSTVDQSPIYRNDAEYMRRLEASPLRDKIRYGRLDSVTGQFFDNWEPQRHVRPAADFHFEDWQPVWVGWDYGFGHFACIVFFTKAILKPRWAGEPAKRVNVAIKEIILHEKTPAEQTEALIASIPRIPRKPDSHEWTEEDAQDEEVQREYGDYRWHIDSIHFSWERFNRTTSNRTVADDVSELLQTAGLPICQRSNTDRIAGWQKIYDLLDTDEFFIIEGQCPTLAEAIPMLVRGDGVTHSIEDVVKPKGLSLNDDIADACRYGIAGTLLDAEDKPEHIRQREKLAAIKDPMTRAVHAYTAYNKKKAAERRPAKTITVPTWYNRVRPQ
jgi:hypothetical protein